MRITGITRQLVLAVTVLAVVAAPASAPQAHCDTLDGPVVQAAREALETGEITPVLMWILPEHEKELREAFARTLSVRTLSDDARSLADRYFFETLVRLHRAGEGAPYTGLKPAGSDLPRAVVLADEALETGSVDELVALLTNAVADGVRRRFDHAHAAKQHVEESVDAGRRFVQAYVVFVHYVEGLYLSATSPPQHHGAAAAPDAAGGHGH